MKAVICLICGILLSSCVFKGSYDPSTQKFDFKGAIIIRAEDYKK